jgi:predicted DsbA family dithiol-disulfide isomerase
LNIQIWSDFRCPFCYIGKNNLEKAIKESGRNAKIEMMSYELDPYLVAEKGMSLHERLANARRITITQAEELNHKVAQMAAEAGLTFHLNAVVDANTFKAHKVLQLAKEQQLDVVFADLGMKAYFEQGKDLENEDELMNLGVQAGLKKEDITRAIRSDEYGLAVRQDEQWASGIGVKGVPHFVFNDKVSLSGAQSVETFLGAMDFADKLNITAKDENNASNNVCTDEFCDIS